MVLAGTRSRAGGIAELNRHEHDMKINEGGIKVSSRLSGLGNLLRKNIPNKRSRMDSGDRVATTKEIGVVEMRKYLQREKSETRETINGARIANIICAEEGKHHKKQKKNARNYEKTTHLHARPPNLQHIAEGGSFRKSRKNGEKRMNETPEMAEKDSRRGLKLWGTMTHPQFEEPKRTSTVQMLDPEERRCAELQKELRICLKEIVCQLQQHESGQRRIQARVDEQKQKCRRAPPPLPRSSESDHAALFADSLSFSRDSQLALPAVPPSPPPSLACGAHNDIRLVDCSGVVRRATERQAESVEILRATVLQPERALAGHATPQRIVVDLLGIGETFHVSVVLTRESSNPATRCCLKREPLGSILKDNSDVVIRAAKSHYAALAVHLVYFITPSSLGEVKLREPAHAACTVPFVCKVAILLSFCGHTDGIRRWSDVVTVESLFLGLFSPRMIRRAVGGQTLVFEAEADKKKDPIRADGRMIAEDDKPRTSAHASGPRPLLPHSFPLTVVHHILFRFLTAFDLDSVFYPLANDSSAEYRHVIWLMN
ncbi:hypothetical protein C8R44DRAFT_748486 [Mycena epipterygia]|nr:hypothetical protein C8R44DRAFT_748486 [Mycena epipterygia]